MTSVVVFDYGFGNVRSMVRALANLGLDTTLTSDYRQALEADGMVVPGVGAFAACMTGLREVSGDRVILDRLRAGRPVLGVCVGEQIMFERGNEHADTTEGLGLIGGTVDLLDADVVPRKMAPAFLMRGTTASASAVWISRCSAAYALAASMDWSRLSVRTMADWLPDSDVWTRSACSVRGTR